MSAVEIVMPRLSDAMEEGTIVRWLKDVGDQVEVGDELVEVETDKATVIYEAEIAGLLSAILVQAGEAQQLGRADRAGSAATRWPPPAPARRRPRPAPAQRDRSPRPSPAAARASWASTSQRCTGTGPRGRIRLADVEAAADRPPLRRSRPRPPPPPRHRPARATLRGGGRGAAERLPLTSTQRVIAQRMAETIATVPHFRLSIDVDFGEILRLRTRLRTAVGDGAPTVNDIVVALDGARAARASRSQQLLRAATPSSATSASTSASPWRAPARCSCPSCATPTAARWARSRARAPR